MLLRPTALLACACLPPPRPVGCREQVLGPYLLTKDEHEKECLLHFLHDQPAGEHTETEAVQPGSAFPDDEAEVAGSAAGGAGSAAGEMVREKWE